MRVNDLKIAWFCLLSGALPPLMTRTPRALAWVSMITGLIWACSFVVHPGLLILLPLLTLMTFFWRPTP